MFVIAIDDPRKAKEFLEFIQDYKQVGYQVDKDGNMVWRRAKVTFIYKTDTTGKCEEHQAEGSVTVQYEDLHDLMRYVEAPSDLEDRIEDILREYREQQSSS